MQLTLSQPEFQAAIPIMRQIETAGFEAYFVGGAVRDALLGLPIHDVDIASSAYPEEIKQIFTKTVDTGIQHGTVMVLDHGTGYEVTTFRTESTYQDFRRPDQVTFVRSLEEDLKRRDFTVNALAVRHDGTVIDLFGGLADLQQKRLAAVGVATERFHEDALRMMRAVRFESQLDFTLTEPTKEAIAQNAALMTHIAVERIASEWSRLMMGPARVKGLASLIDTELYQYLPDLAGQKTALRQFAALPATSFSDVAVGWSLMSHLLQAKPGALLKHWKQANALIRLTQAATTLLGQLPEPTNWQLYQAGGQAVVVALEAAAFLNPDFDPTAVAAQQAALAIHDKAELAVTGQHLIEAGMRPGPQLGRTLAQLEQAVVAGELANQQVVLLNFALGENFHA